jgi:hypothetical protein
VLTGDLGSDSLWFAGDCYWGMMRRAVSDALLVGSMSVESAGGRTRWWVAAPSYSRQTFTVAGWLRYDCVRVAPRGAEPLCRQC